MMKRFIVFLLLNTCMGAMVMSQTLADSVQILFQPGNSQIKLDSDNYALHLFAKKVRKCIDDGNLERLLIRAYTSPDGVSTTNIQLSADRCQSIADYIITHTGADADMIDCYPCGIAWEKLRRMIVSDYHVPGRRKALNIIDNTPIWVHNTQGRISGSRKKKLMDFQGGQTYRWLRLHFFEELHYATIELYVKNPKKKYNFYIPKNNIVLNILV